MGVAMAGWAARLPEIGSKGIGVVKRAIIKKCKATELRRPTTVS